MCVCVYRSSNGKVSIDRLHEAYSANPDGCGLMWAHDDELFVVKGHYSFDDFLHFYRDVKEPCVLHFRTASSGKISDDASHPLFVNENLAFVENGNLPEYSNGFREWEDDLTDVQRFNNLFLKLLPKNFLYRSDTMQAIESYCKNRMVKMIFMDNLGKVKIVNEEAGEWRDGCWFSNGGIENYVGYGYSGAYEYKAGETRHFGGLESVQMFDAKDRKKYKQCQTCRGWFPKDKILAKHSCVGCTEWLMLMELVK